jgi:hypothetical protein
MSANTGIGWRQRLGVGVKKYDNMDIIKGFIAFIVQVFIIASGSLLINNQLTISEKDPDASTVLNYTVGSILIVVGSLMVLYSIFLMIRPARAVV